MSTIDFDEFLQRAVRQAAAEDNPPRRRALYQNARETLLKKAATAPEPTGRLLLEFENAVDRVERTFAASPGAATASSPSPAQAPPSAKPRNTGFGKEASSYGGQVQPSSDPRDASKQPSADPIELPPPPVFPEFPEEPGYDDPLTSRRRNLEKALVPAVEARKEEAAGGGTMNGPGRGTGQAETDAAPERFPSFLTATPRGIGQAIRAKPEGRPAPQAATNGTAGGLATSGALDANDPEWLETAEAGEPPQTDDDAETKRAIRRYALPGAVLLMLMGALGAAAHFGVKQLGEGNVPIGTVELIPAANDLTGEGWRVIDAIAEDVSDLPGAQGGGVRTFRLIDDSTVRLGRVSAPLNEAGAPEGFRVSVNLEKVERRVANFALVQVAFPLTRNPVTFGAKVDLLTGDVNANGQASDADISVIDDGTSWRIVLAAPMPEGVLFGKPLLEIFPAAGVSLQTLDPRGTGVINVSNVDVSAL